VLYADKVTESMQRAIDETARRRLLQLEYNRQHGITPETIRKAIRRGIEEEREAQQIVQNSAGIQSNDQYVTQEHLNELESEMLAAAKDLDFERAARLRDRILELKQHLGQAVRPEDTDSPGFADSRSPRRGRRRGTKGKRVPWPDKP
jgi:excinuclease ABC subunit B